MTSIPNIRLSITHEVGQLTFSKQQLAWQNKHNPSHQIIVDAADIKSIEWLDSDKKNKLMSIGFQSKSRALLRFVGFSGEDEIEIDNLCKANLGKGLAAKHVCTTGANWGKFMLRAQELVFRTENKVTFCTIPYNTISQAVIQAKNEISLEFKQDLNQSTHNNNNNNNNRNNNNNNRRGEYLCELRLFIPDDDDAVPAYQEFHNQLQKKAKLGHENDNVIAMFPKVTFRIPRGKKEIKFMADCFQFRTDTYSYSIKYGQIKRLFVFEQPGQKVAFLVHLSPGIRQGNKTYGYLIMEFPADEVSRVEINATEEELKTIYTSKAGKQVLFRETEGETFDVLSRVFMALSKMKIIAARKFSSVHGYKCVRCSYGPNSGLLYPLEKALFYMWNPPMYVRHSELSSVKVLRMEESHSIRMFDLELKTKKRDTLLFTGIDKAEYECLLRYFLAKDKTDMNIIDRDFHERRVSHTNMSSSSRSTRTRKNLRPSTINYNAGGGADGGGGGGAGDAYGDSDSEEDEDYNMDDDQNMLLEDDELEAHYDDMVEEDDDHDDYKSAEVEANDDDADDDLLVAETDLLNVDDYGAENDENHNKSNGSASRTGNKSASKTKTANQRRGRRSSQDNEDIDIDVNANVSPRAPTSAKKKKKTKTKSKKKHHKKKHRKHSSSGNQKSNGDSTSSPTTAKTSSSSKKSKSKSSKHRSSSSGKKSSSKHKKHKKKHKNSDAQNNTNSNTNTDNTSNKNAPMVDVD